MSIRLTDCCIVNAGMGAWAFEPLALKLSEFLGIEISESPRQYNYFLHVENPEDLNHCKTFIPLEGIRLASDKRSLARKFLTQEVPTPETRLFERYEEIPRFLGEHAEREWCLKYPTSCGANGHRMISANSTEPSNWPGPFIVQEFIRLECLEVLRIYGAGGEMFGWFARRFPEGTTPSPWVAHAQGARYVNLKTPPRQAEDAARRALVATMLWESFGCVDLIQRPTGQWVVLEVGTDGLFNHVDREIGDENFEQELHRRIANAFWKSAPGSE